MTSVHDFLVSTARNFRVMLEPFVKTDAHRTLLSQYSEKDVETLTLTYLMPLYRTGTLSIASSRVVSELDIKDAVIIEKITRYFSCFCEALAAKPSCCA